jgi:hypothetical protein
MTRVEIDVDDPETLASWQTVLEHGGRNSRSSLVLGLGTMRRVRGDRVTTPTVEMIPSD